MRVQPTLTILGVLGLLTACGGAGGGAGVASLGAPTGIPPGTTAFSGNSGDAGLQVAAGSGLTYIDNPVAGEPSIVGQVLVSDFRQGLPLLPPPADTTVTLNGVRLVHAVVNGVASDRFFTVDPAGPQPTIASDGFLHITASSASASLTRTLFLACPFFVPVTSTPPAGSALAAGATLQLAWTDPLPQQPLGFSEPGFSGPAATLAPYDPALDRQTGPFIGPSMLPTAHHASIQVSAPSATGYLAELRYPGIFFIDGQTGGFCGRTTRLVFSASP
ncbi:MAG TPA: hypothetical protein VF400_14310 [Anaeromyxobacteraceae bacterium]